MRERAVGIASALMFSCGALVAAETIAVGRVQQRYPWNGLVDIDYAISGVEGDPNDYQVEFTVTADGRSFIASNFYNAAWCDHTTANGTNRATWIARMDGVTALTGVGVSARLVYAPCTDADATFAVIDLSSGFASSHYPVRYVAAETNRATAFNIPVYKTRKLVLKKVPAGEFWMGVGDVSDGTDRHRVRLTRDYWLGLFEVTRGQYWSVLPRNTMQVTTALYQFMPFLADDYDTVPISYVSQDNILDTDGFIARLNARTRCRGQSVGLFSLPTEAQWERAARAGTETRYFTGSTTNDLPAYASMSFTYQWSSGAGTWVPAASPDALTPIEQFPFHVYAAGSFLPTPWGFYDIYGNVAEWCADFYGSYPAYSETDVTEDPTGPSSAAEVVSRGGCFWEGDGRCSSGGRVSGLQTGAEFSGYGNRFGSRFGFRLAGALK